MQMKYTQIWNVRWHANIHVLSQGKLFILGSLSANKSYHDQTAASGAQSDKDIALLTDAEYKFSFKTTHE